MKAKLPSTSSLEELYLKYQLSEEIQNDPLGRVSKTLLPEDFEIISFVVAGLSYGRVQQIQNSTESLYKSLRKLSLGPSGEGIARWLKTSPKREELRAAFAGWKHRMNTADDLVGLLEKLSQALCQYGSLCELYQKHHESDPVQQIAAFCEHFSESPIKDKRRIPKAWQGTGTSWFACSPLGGGTSKRLMMWFRWMIRRDQIDPGTWRVLASPHLPAPDPARLFWPVDTHVFRWAKNRKIVTSKNPTWKSVTEITDFFRKRNSADPVKYDFAICHEGMKESEQARHTKTVKNR